MRPTGGNMITWCDFVICTPHGASVQRIERDDNLWKQMYSKLKAFYHEYLLPELADPVFTVASRSDTFNSLRSCCQL